MKLHLPFLQGVTLIENTFIDLYMPKASGEYVKIYLYLLRCASTGRDLSLSSIADFFDYTEKDVRRALMYWEKLDLLKLKHDKNGAITDIIFSDGFEKDTVSEAKSHIREKTTPTASQEPVLQEDVLPDKNTLSRDRKKTLQEQEQIRNLFYVAERYFGRPLSSTESSNLMYFYDTLHFSTDLIEYLIEYCISKGSPGPRYMEKVAQEWYKSGITTVADAKSNTNLYNKNYYTIFHSLGINGRSPAPAEIDYMNRWLTDYDFSIEIILEACNRTIRQIHEPKFGYVDSILERWHKSGVHSLSDLQRLDAKHAQLQAKNTRPSPQQTGNRFQNFTQREYDWNNLERQLLGAQEKKEG